MTPELETRKETKTDHGEEKLPGTFIAVMLLGLLILASWFGVYGLFLSR